jgi:hypothetical protein
VQPDGLERTERPRPSGGRLAIAATVIVVAMLGVFLLALAWLSMAVFGQGADPHPMMGRQAGHSLGRERQAGATPAHP